MNFKDLQFSLGKLSSDVKSHMAKKNPLYKNDTKVLSVWIFQERNDLATMRTLAYRRGETNKSFREWATNGHEHWNDDDEYTDLQDIGDKLATLLGKANEIEQQYAASYQQYRHAIKAIREREDALCDRREKRQSLSARLVHLEKTNPTSPKRQDIEAELRTLDKETQMAEIELGDFKRFALQEAFYIRFNALSEYADKMKIVAGFGKYIVDLLDVEPTVNDTTDHQQQQQQQQQNEAMANDHDSSPPTRKPYTSESQASLILNDCLFALDQWKPTEEEERPTLASQAIHDASNDEDANLLTEEDIRYYREQGLATLISTQMDYTTNSKETTSNISQQCQLPMYDDDTDMWMDEKCLQRDRSSAAAHHQAPPSSTMASIGKRQEAEYERLQNKADNSDISPPTYTTAIQSPLPSTVQDHTRNDTTPGETATATATTTTTTTTAAAAAAAAATPITITTTDETNAATTAGDTDASTLSSLNATHPEFQPPHTVDYYQVYRNKQISQSSHPPRPYASFQQLFIHTSGDKANT